MTEAPPPPSEPGRPDEPSGATPPPPPPPPAGGEYPPPGEYGAPPPGDYGAPPPGAGYPQGYPTSQLSPQDERTWGMFAHLSALVFAFIALAFIGPLLVMLTQGQKSAFVRSQAVEALNFQITTYIAGIVSALLILLVIGLVLLPLVGIAWLIFTIIAAVAANRGEDYRYPVNIRLVK